MDTTFNSSVKDNTCHLTPNLLVSSLDCCIPQSSPHTPLSLQPESPVITSQPTTPSRLPRTQRTNPINFPSTSTGTSPPLRNTATLRIISRELYGKQHF